MKTNENSGKSSSRSNSPRTTKNSKRNENLNKVENSKDSRWYNGTTLVLMNGIWAILLIIVILLMNCNDTKKETSLNNSLKQLTSKVDSLESSLNHYKSLKPVVFSQRKTVEGKTGTYIQVFMCDSSNNLPSEIFIEDVCPPYSVSKKSSSSKSASSSASSLTKGAQSPVIVNVNCDNSEILNKLEDIENSLDSLIGSKSKGGLIGFGYETESENDSIEMTMTKTAPDDTIELYRQKLSVYAFLNAPVNPVISHSYDFTEYRDNPYRKKSENAFWGGVAFGSAAVLTYAWTESLGHPKYRDYGDNSSAERKSDIILAGRITSGALAAVSLIEFGRAWHFHKLEGKYIISPTKVGASISLDKRRE